MERISFRKEAFYSILIWCTNISYKIYLIFIYDTNTCIIILLWAGWLIWTWTWHKKEGEIPIALTGQICLTSTPK